MKNSIWLIFGFIIFLSCNFRNSKNGNEIVINNNLNTHLDYLASEDLKGRKTNEDGYLKAADYVSGFYEEISLEEFLIDPKSNTSWFQQVPFVDYHNGDQNWLSLKDQERLKIEKDYFVLNRGNSNGLISIDSLFYSGFGIHEPDLGWDDFEGMDISGKFILIVDGIPSQDDFPEIYKLHSKAHLSLARKIEYLSNKNAAGLIIVSEASRKFWNLSSKINDKLGYKPIEPSFWADPYHPELPVIMIHPEAFKKSFPKLITNINQDNYPVTNFIYSPIEFFIDIDNRLFDAPNVVGSISGIDPALAKEFIILSAHLDHIGSEGDETYYGANDNASSCAVLLEIAGKLVKNPLKRTVVFVFYTAEEPCLWGSQYFVSNFPYQKEKIKVNINVEMVGKRDKGYIGTTAIGPADFERYFEKTNPLSVNYLDQDSHMDKYKGSDQLSFYRENIAAIRFGNLDYPEKHTSKDDISIIDFDYLSGIEETLLGIIYRIDNE